MTLRTRLAKWDPGALVVKRRTLYLLLPSLSGSVLWLLWATAEERLIVAPIVAAANVVVWVWVVLWNRDRVCPLFDLGGICLAFSALYSLMPFFTYLLSGMTYGLLSDPRLRIYAASPKEYEAFAWRYVVYLVSFGIAYVLIRGRVSIRSGNVQPPDRQTVVALLAMALLFSGLLHSFEMLYGLDFSVAYDSALGDAYSAFQSMPLIARQALSKIYSSIFILKLGLLTILIASWRRRRWRYVVYGWLCVATIGYLFKMGARTELALLFLSAALLYHRLVRPLKPAAILTGGALLLVALLGFGLMRGGSTLGENLSNLQTVLSHDSREFVTAASEYETLFAGTYDLYRMKQAGLIANVPWQVYATEILMLIPQQVLPFEKVDVQEWYRDLSPNPSYFMYGPISQAILGLDWIELVLRGSLLGWLFGRIHRWYACRAGSFWATLFYVWLMVWSYYTIRSSTLYFLAFILYQYIPTIIFVYMIRELLRVGHWSGRRVSQLVSQPVSG